MKRKTHGGAIVDVGNPIIDHIIARTTREKVETPGWYRTIPPAHGAFQGLKALSEAFGGNVTLVYNATNTVDSLIREWFKVHRLTELTGIPLSRVRRTTHGRNKTPFMDQESETHYGTTVVVDDRFEVMSHFLDLEPMPLLFLHRPQYQAEAMGMSVKMLRQLRSQQNRWHHLLQVDSWAEIVASVQT